MKKLRKVSYYPVLSGTSFVRDIQIQIVYAVLGIVNVYEVPDDPLAVSFIASEDDHSLIQQLINEHLTAIMNANKHHALTYLFTKGMYVGRPGLVPIKRSISCKPNCDREYCLKKAR